MTYSGITTLDPFSTALSHWLSSLELSTSFRRAAEWLNFALRLNTIGFEDPISSSSASLAFCLSLFCSISARNWKAADVLDLSEMSASSNEYFFHLCGLTWKTMKSRKKNCYFVDFSDGRSPIHSRLSTYFKIRRLSWLQTLWNRCCWTLKYAFFSMESSNDRFIVVGSMWSPLLFDWYLLEAGAFDALLRRYQWIEQHFLFVCVICVGHDFVQIFISTCCVFVPTEPFCDTLD